MNVNFGLFQELPKIKGPKLKKETKSSLDFKKQKKIGQIGYQL